MRQSPVRPCSDDAEVAAVENPQTGENPPASTKRRHPRELRNRIRRENFTSARRTATY